MEMRQNNLIRTLLFSLLIPLPSAHSQWIKTGVPTGTAVFSIAVAPVRGGYPPTVFAATGPSGVIQSTDGGITWTAVYGLTSSHINCLAVWPNNAGGNNLYAGGDGNGIFLSVDNGASWVGTGLRGNVQSILTYNKMDTTYLLVSILGGGVYRSTVNGASWTQVNTGLTTTTVDAFAAIPAIGGYGMNVFAGTDSGVFRSTNDGANWTAVNSGLMDNTVVHCFAVSADGSGGRSVFAGSSSGVYRSTDDGPTWTQRNAGISVSNILSLAVSADGAGITSIFAGTNAGIFRSTDNGERWSASSPSMEGFIVSALGVVQTIGGPFVSLYAGTNGGLFRSTNNGETWVSATPGGWGGNTPCPRDFSCFK
jgi:hypothetical protein